MAQSADGRAGSVTAALSYARDLGLAFAAAITAYVHRRQSARVLARLDDRMLADIGVTRGDVESALLEPVWRDPTKRLAVMAIERRAATRAVRSEARKEAIGTAELVAD